MGIRKSEKLISTKNTKHKNSKLAKKNMQLRRKIRPNIHNLFPPNYRPLVSFSVIASKGSTYKETQKMLENTFCFSISKIYFDKNFHKRLAKFFQNIKSAWVQNLFKSESMEIVNIRSYISALKPFQRPTTFLYLFCQPLFNGFFIGV